MFQWEKCAKELYDTLSELRQYELHDMQYTIIQLMQVKNFFKLRNTIYLLLQIGRINNAELLEFERVMLDNGIDLNDYL